MNQNTQLITILTTSLLLAAPTQAANKVETNLPITVGLTDTCEVEASGITGFGNWPLGAADLTGVALGTITVTCGAEINYAVGLSAGQNVQGGRRQLINGTNFIPYTLWTDVNRTTEWGDAGIATIDPNYVETHSATAVQVTGTGSAQSFSLWGDAAIKSAGVPAGNYQDTVVVTVVWP